jgi:hypothetical protein
VATFADGTSVPVRFQTRLLPWDVLGTARTVEVHHDDGRGWELQFTVNAGIGATATRSLGDTVRDVLDDLLRRAEAWLEQIRHQTTSALESAHEPATVTPAEADRQRPSQPELTPSGGTPSSSVIATPSDSTPEPFIDIGGTGVDGADIGTRDVHGAVNPEELHTKLSELDKKS